MIDFDEVRAANSRRFREVLADVPGTARVPSCPDWSAADLLWHLTEVQNFWATIVEERLQVDQQVEAVAAPPRPAVVAAALAQFDSVSQRLGSGLAAARDDEPVWTWTPDHTVGWVRRRQAQEALVHRVDAELTAGMPSEIDAEAAEDGVDELLTQFGAQPPAWGAFDPCGMLVEVRSRPSLRSWRVRLGRFRGVDPAGRRHDEPDYQPVIEPGDPADALGPAAWTSPDVVLEGPAAELLLWLWGRADGAGITTTGEASARAALREAIVANTQ
jgi:uncharacterized protein (TIGR03083 family)